MACAMAKQEPWDRSLARMQWDGQSPLGRGIAPAHRAAAGHGIAAANWIAAAHGGARAHVGAGANKALRVGRFCATFLAHRRARRRSAGPVGARIRLATTVVELARMAACGVCHGHGRLPHAWLCPSTALGRGVAHARAVCGGVDLISIWGGYGVDPLQMYFWLGAKAPPCKRVHDGHAP